MLFEKNENERRGRGWPIYKTYIRKPWPQIYISTYCVRSDHFESIMITHFCNGLNLCVADLFLTGLESVKINNIFTCLVESQAVTQEVNDTAILPVTKLLSILWIGVI